MDCFIRGLRRTNRALDLVRIYARCSQAIAMAYCLCWMNFPRNRLDGIGQEKALGMLLKIFHGDATGLGQLRVVGEWDAVVLGSRVLLMAVASLVARGCG